MEKRIVIFNRLISSVAVELKPVFSHHSDARTSRHLWKENQQAHKRNILKGLLSKFSENTQGE